MRNAFMDSLEITGPLGLTLANNTYINWRNAAGVASVIGIGLSNANDFVIRNEGKNSSTLYFQTTDAGGVVHHAGAFGHQADSLSIFSVTASNLPYIGFFNQSLGRQGYLQIQPTQLLTEVEAASSQMVFRIHSAANTAFDMQWHGASGTLPPTFFLGGKGVVSAGDSYLRLNQDLQWGNGIYTPGAVRFDAGLLFGASFGLTTESTTYGNVTTLGAGVNNWSGYNIADRCAWMHDGSAYAGLYNIINAHWMLLATFNADTALYHAGISTVRTQVNNFQVWDGAAFRNVFKGATFVSAQQAVATFGSVAHGLGALPTNWQVVLVCTTIDKGYAVGDEVDLVGGFTGAGNPTAWASPTAIGWAMVSTTPFIISKGAVTSSAIVAASWRIVVKGQLWQ
jgi:hypothetical protein